jgi:hypothetical protein
MRPQSGPLFSSAISKSVCSGISLAHSRSPTDQAICRLPRLARSHSHQSLRSPSTLEGEDLLMLSGEGWHKRVLRQVEP